MREKQLKGTACGRITGTWDFLHSLSRGLAERVSAVTRFEAVTPVTHALASERNLVAATCARMLKDWSDRWITNLPPGIDLSLFTPEVGLLDMVKHGGIRAKEAIKIKNGKEIFPSLDVLTGHLTDLIAAAPPNDRAFAVTLHKMLDQMRQSAFSIRTFVGCFCMNADRPVLWSRFGQQGQGYMLVFRSDFVVRRDVADDYPYVVGSVIYEDDQKRKTLDSIFTEGSRQLLELETKLRRRLSGDHLKLFTSCIACEVALSLVLMKPEKSRDEQEWRVAYAQQDEVPLRICRFETGVPYPYVRLSLSDKVPASNHRLPIEQVVLGKYASQSEDWVFNLLASHGYNIPRCAIRRSDVDPDDPSSS